MRKSSIYIYLICGLCLFIANIAIASAPSQSSVTPPDDQILQVKDAVTVPLLCPLPSQLVKSKKNIWHYHQFWHSYDISFASTLNRFRGAQWSGSDVGTIICIYSEVNKNNPQQQNFTFPVLVYFSGLAKIPTGKYWSSRHGTYKNCTQSDVKRCPFLAYTKNKNKIDFYKTSVDLRKNDNSD